MEARERELADIAAAEGFIRDCRVRLLALSS